MSEHAIPTIPLPGEPAAEVASLNVESEAQLFWWMRRVAIFNTLTSALAQARTRLVLVTLLTCVLWLALFLVFADGFRFLHWSITDRTTHGETLRALLNVFYASLTVMLVFSSGILIYGSLYRSDEVRFLLTTPTSDERVFVHKFQEAMLYSAWAFLLLGTPMLVAFGISEGAQGWFYLILLPLLLAFAYLPGCVGAICCLVIVRFLPAHRRNVLVALGGVLAVGLVIWAWQSSRGIDHDWLSTSWIQELLGRLEFTEHRLLPNWWLSAALLEAVRAGLHSKGERAALGESALFAAVLISNSLLGHVLVVRAARWWFRRGYAALQSSGAAQRRRNVDVLERGANWLFRWVRPQIRLLIVKDLRLFRRDPVQWSQFLVFLALLTMYFVNSRKLGFDLDYAVLINMISFLNLAIVGLLLSTFTTRFIFPLVSLEGRRFWILGLLPVKRDEILYSKFLLAAVGATIPCGVLLVLGDLMLGVGGYLIVIHLVVCMLLCSGLSGIAVGLGARLPNLRHESPARIAAGFGGTLTLVISTAYIVAVVVLAAVPCHYYAATRELIHPREGLMPLLWIAGLGGSTLLGILATVIPLRMGLRAFRQLEA
ncbi:MAG: hypothetical protein JSS27_21385 [Planctomycetes bacterium]|nr:hypothetical protein [Planctomycetota bacterium]